MDIIQTLVLVKNRATTRQNSEASTKKNRTKLLVIREQNSVVSIIKSIKQQSVLVKGKI